MLGCQRTSVTLVAHALQKSGLIRYTRGKIEIFDRHAIEECACECYGVLRRETEKAVPRRHETLAFPAKRCVNRSLGSGSWSP
jgi:hypothetical protein